MQVAISKWHKGKDISEVLLQCILSIFPASVHQFYANILVFVNINPFLYINDQFALFNICTFFELLKYPLLTIDHTKNEMNTITPARTHSISELKS